MQEDQTSPPQNTNPSPTTPPPQTTPPAQPAPSPQPVAPLPQPSAPAQSTDTTSVTEEATILDRTEKLKRLFFKILIGCLLASASIAVIAVLVGSFSDTLGRALGTIAMVAFHALLSFSYISETDKRNKKDGGRSIELFSNTVFVLIVLSFITSIFAIWQLLGGDLTARLYMIYGVLLFATLHADVLYRIRSFEKNIDNVVTANYVLMTIVVIMLITLILTGDPGALGDVFYRVLAACGIIDATLTITAIIMHKMYLQKHPVAAAEASASSPRTKNFWRNPLVVIILIYLTFQVIGSIIVTLVRF